jgi:signal transduction histidine kinase
VTELRRAWGPNAISRWSLLTTLVMIVLVGLPGFPEAPDYTLPKRVVIAIAAAVPALLLLALAHALWLRPGGGGNRAVRAIITFAAAGALSAAVRGWIIDAVGIENPIPPGWRIPATAVAAVIWLALVAIVVDHVRQHRQAMQQLREQQEVLADLDRRERDELNEVTRRLRDDLLTPARQALARISNGIAALQQGSELSAEAARVQDAVVATIRPLSHEILAADPAEALIDGQPTQQHMRGRVRRLLEAASHRVTHSPWLVSAVPVVLFPLIAGPRWGYAFLVVNAVVTWVALSLLLIGLRAVLEPRLARMPLAAALISLWAGYVAVLAMTLLITMALDSLSPLPIGYPAVALITIPPILLAASVLEAAVDLSVEDERRLRAVIADITWSLARMRQRIRHEHQMLGTLLHGRVQGALVGVARALESAPPDMPAAGRANLVEDSLTTLRDVEVMLDSPPDEGHSLDDALDDLLALWRRSLVISLDVSDAARRALDGDPAARRVTVDVIAECLTNALRHGGARSAWISLTAAAGSLDLTVEDDGTLSPGPAGMGSALFDEASPQWSRVRDGGRTVVRLRVPARAA